MLPYNSIGILDAFSEYLLHLPQKNLYFCRCTMALFQVDYEQWFTETRTARPLLSNEK